MPGTGNAGLSCWQLLSVLGRGRMAVTFAVQLCWTRSPCLRLPPHAAMWPFLPLQLRSGRREQRDSPSPQSPARGELGHALKVVLPCVLTHQKALRQSQVGNAPRAGKHFLRSYLLL